MKLEELKENDERANFVPVNEFIQHIQDEFEQIVEEYEEHITKGDTIPAGPDTTKFRASRGGMLEVAEKLQHSGGRYGLPKTLIRAIKVGGKIDYKIHKKIKQEVKDFWADMVEGNKENEGSVKESTITTKEGFRLYYGDITGGTNWSAYGVVIAQPIKRRKG